MKYLAKREITRANVRSCPYNEKMEWWTRFKHGL